MTKKQNKSNTQKPEAAKVTDNKVPTDQPEQKNNLVPDTTSEPQDLSLDDQIQVSPESKGDQGDELSGETQNESLDDKTQGDPKPNENPALSGPTEATGVVRVTSPINVDDKTYQPNNLVKNLPAAAFDTLLKKKRISQCESGIKYCKDELKAEVVDHTAPVESEEK